MNGNLPLFPKSGAHASLSMALRFAGLQLAWVSTRVLVLSLSD